MNLSRDPEAEFIVPLQEPPRWSNLKCQVPHEGTGFRPLSRTVNDFSKFYNWLRKAGLNWHPP